MKKEANNSAAQVLINLLIIIILQLDVYLKSDLLIIALHMSSPRS